MKSPEEGNQTMPRKRVLIVDNDESYFSNHRISVARGASEAGYDVHVGFPLIKADVRARHPEFTFHHVPFDRVGTNPVKDLQTLLGLRRLYREVQPDLVHLFSIKPVLYGGLAARSTSVPHVVGAMTGLGLLFGSDSPRVRALRAVVVPGLRIACRPDNVRMIFENREDCSLFTQLKICTPETGRVISGSGVNTDLFSPSPEVEATPMVLFASRMLWEKGVDDFVDAARRLKAEGLDARFVLAGGTDPNPTAIPEETLRRWHAEGVVEWLGQCDDMPELIRQSHIVCLPTRYREGVPRILIEGASAGRPLITTDMPGCRDIVRDQENGLVVPVRDVDALSAAIRSLVESPSRRREMGASGRALVEEHFSERRVIEQTMDLYREMESEARAPGR